MINPNTLKPFGKFCVTLGMIPSSYKASLTYEEQLLWFCDYLENKVIPAVNNNAEALQEVQALYEEIRQFIVDYFAHLDLQDEIDNKLDEMVEDGTLAEIINEQIFDDLNKKIENEVKYHFIKTGNLKGDCILIQTKNKVFLNDLSASTNYQDITNYLSLNNISHIDGIIISHFHFDHIGGSGAEAFISLINSTFVNSNTQIYLPSTPDFTKFINDTSTSASDVVGRVTAMMNAVINSANSKGLTINYMSTNDTLNIDNVTFRFLNCSEEQYDNYYNVTETFDGGLHYCTIYNNFSMVLEISNIANTTLLTGDIEKEAETVLAPFINKNITLKKLEHHGLNRLSDANYLIKTNSNINVIMSTQEDNEMMTMRESLGYIFLTGKKLYATLENSSICFIDTGHNVYPSSNLQEKLLDTMSVISGLTGINAGGLKNLNLSSYKNSIKENDDLNDFVIPGDYCCYTSDVSSTIDNKPLNTNYAFKLTVEQTTNTQRIMQRLVYNINQYMEYVRYFFGSWTPWKRIKVDEKVQVTFNNNIVIADTDYHKIAFNNLDFGNIFSLNEQGNLVCNQAGDYIINANICIGGSNLTSGDRIVLRINKNNERAFLTQQDISSYQQIVTISGFILHLSLNDVVDLSYRNLTGARGTVIAEQSFMSITN